MWTSYRSDLPEDKNLITSLALNMPNPQLTKLLYISTKDSYKSLLFLFILPLHWYCWVGIHLHLLCDKQLKGPSLEYCPSAALGICCIVVDRSLHCWWGCCNIALCYSSNWRLCFSFLRRCSSALNCWNLFPDRKARIFIHNSVLFRKRKGQMFQIRTEFSNKLTRLY